MKERPLIQQVARQMLAAGLTPLQGARETQKEMIAESLREHHGNICRTARAIGLHRNTLSRKLAELGIANVALECRADLANQKALRFSGRLSVRRSEDVQSRVA
jgi:DNA-binding NtrC family response regulator